MSENNEEIKAISGEHHYHHHHHHHHGKSSTASAERKTLKYRIKKLWKKFMRKILKDGGKKEVSLLLAIVIIMAISVPVVIAILDAIHNFFTISV